MTDTNRLINWQRSIFDFIINNAGTAKSSTLFTFADAAKPSGCGNVDILVQYGYPEDLSKVTGPMIAIDDPAMPDPPYAGLVEEFDLRTYIFWIIVLGQEINYNRRLRDRLAERFRNLFQKGTYIEILDYEQKSKPVVDCVYTTYCDTKIVKSSSTADSDRFRASVTVNCRGLY